MAARKALESTYDGVATVIEHQKVRNEKTKLTEYEDVTVLEGQPCKLSFSSIAAVIQSESAASTTQTTKLFISPDIKIKPGSKITVTQSGVTNDYTYSGVPAVYQTHQEIMLDFFKDWA
jgi:hypothetical protein